MTPFFYPTEPGVCVCVCVLFETYLSRPRDLPGGIKRAEYDHMIGTAFQGPPSPFTQTFLHLNRTTPLHLFRLAPPHGGAERTSALFTEHRNPTMRSCSTSRRLSLPEKKFLRGSPQTTISPPPFRGPPTHASPLS